MEIRKLDLSELDAAAGVLGRGMRDNPVHIAAWRSTAEKRERVLGRFFRPALDSLWRRGEILGAFRDRALMGICGLAPPGCCAIPTRDKLRVLPALVFGNSPGVPLRILRWTSAWSSRDLPEPHWHLGPVGVDLDLQGKGIGSELLSTFCARVDGQQGVAYLETDKPENVRFYQKFGFALLAEAPVLGIPNWFMRRPAASD